MSYSRKPRRAGRRTGSMRGIMRSVVVFGSLLTTVPAASAQAPGDIAGFIITLGADTLAVEQYRRSPTSLESEIALRVPSARRVHFLAALDTSGRMTRFDLTIRPLNQNSTAPAQGTIAFGRDSADLTLTLGDSTRWLRIPAHLGAVPLSAFSASLVEQAIMQARRAGGDSVAFDWLAFGSPEAAPSYVAKRGKDSVVVGFFGYPLHARVDRHGRLLGLDGRETTQKVMVNRVRDVNVGAFATAFAQAEVAHGPPGQLSPRDTVWANVAGAHLRVDYGRPWKRGREIFGGVVPWHRVWRTGANAATQFTTDKDLRAGTEVIPAGSYSLWMLPDSTGAKLIVNRQTGQWGTDYDPSRDLVRLDLSCDTLAQTVENFTIRITPRDSGGVMTLSWGERAFWLPFTVKR